MQELENRKKCYEMLSSGYGNASPFIKSKYVCLPAQELHKIKPAKILALIGKVLSKLHTLIKSFAT